MATIYENNEVKITIEVIDDLEAKVNINGENLMWICRSDESLFKKELSELLDRYRI